MSGAPAPAERSLARLDVDATPHAGRVTMAMVEAATSELGLTDDQARHVAVAAAAVSRAIQLRGFDDPATAGVHVEVLRVGHRVVVRIDDLGLPFDYDDAEPLDGAVLQQAIEHGWIDEVHHKWRGRDGNRTELIRHIDPGRDLRAVPPAEGELVAMAEIEPETRLGTPDDADAICRLTWRTYGPTYQHDEYYQPDRLARMLADATQVSFVTTDGAGEIIGHSAIMLDEPGAVVVEAGRAMVDPRFRGHQLMRRPRDLRRQWFAEHGVLAMAGAAVTAHTRSQRDGPVLSVLLGFLPPITFEGIDGTSTPLREAVVGGLVAMASIPPQAVRPPARDAEMLRRLYDYYELDRPFVLDRENAPEAVTSSIDVAAWADLGHAVVSVRSVGADLPDQVAQRLRAVRAGGIEVAYVDLPLDDPATSWAADQLAAAGAIFAGVLPLQRRGVDVVRYQHLGSTVVDPAAIHLKHEAARELLEYVLSQRGENP